VFRTLLFRRLGRRDYAPVFDAMRAFTETRVADTLDELWWVEHPPVFTKGWLVRPSICWRRARFRHSGGSRRPGDLSRAGQVVVYCLVDVRRLGFSVRDW